MSNHVEILIPVLHKLLRECKIALITNSGLVPVDAMREEVKEGRVGSLLDRYFHVLSSHAELETGYRETLALPKCPRRDLIRRIFEDALSVAVPSPA